MVMEENKIVGEKMYEGQESKMNLVLGKDLAYLILCRQKLV